MRVLVCLSVVAAAGALRIQGPVSRAQALRQAAVFGAGFGLALQPKLAEAKVSKSGVDVTPMSRAEAETKAKELPDMSRAVLMEARTERSFTGQTVNGFGWDTKKKGVWKSAISDVPLFSSTDKYDSGTGWPSFSRPLDKDHIVERIDPGDKGMPRFLQRVEVLDAKSGSHLGHVFNDGPPPTGKRYCMNAAAFVFEPEQ